MLLFTFIPGMLMEDCPPKKRFAYFRENISKGELVQLTTSDQWIMVSSMLHNISVSCQKNQTKFINRSFIPYLLAVTNALLRYNLFIHNTNSLALNVLLNIGDKVDVILEQYNSHSEAVVRYKGTLPTKKGIFFGIEILVSCCTHYVYNLLACCGRAIKLCCCATKCMYVYVCK